MTYNTSLQSSPIYCLRLETRVSPSEEPGEEGEPVPMLKHPFSTGLGEKLSSNNETSDKFSTGAPA